MDKGPRMEPDLVEEFVGRAHIDLDRTRELLTAHPGLLDSTWDWGGGDWETGLGGASHMGRRDIATFLVESGARVDVFAAAMLGLLDVVKAHVAVRPEVARALGPHGIPLIAHAQAGGEEAAEVLAFLRELERKGV